MPNADLEHVPDEIWQQLQAGTGPWRTPVLASAMPDGGADARVVVVRGVSVADRELVFFTDCRSGKMAQLEADSAVCMVVHDDARGLQVRLYGHARREHEPALLDAWWQGLAAHQRALYAAGDTGDAHAENAKGRGNFAAFHVIVTRFHCLWIDAAGNRAARFTWEAGWRSTPCRP